MVVVLSVWLAVVVLIMVMYGIRHWIMTVARLFGSQRPYYQDLLDSELPGISVLVPMHNEELVAATCLDALLSCDYPRGSLEIIPIDDHSEDATAEILDEYARRHESVKPILRRGVPRGKPAALNDAMAIAAHEIILVFDADYIPPRDTLRQLAMAFCDPEVGAVMGRVVPRNTSNSLLARLLDLERSGGYQVDQQARFNLDLIPQYGGTVGGFRRSAAMRWGGFNPALMAEDTDMTFRLYTRGYRVAYANRVECYEEVPQEWEARFKQLRRWARGHTQALFHHLAPVIKSPHLSLAEKLDAVLLLGVYMVPPLIVSAVVTNLVLFLEGATPVGPNLALSFFVVIYGAFGNFAPFYQIGVAGLIDGMRERLRLLPFLFLLFMYNTLAVTCGVGDALVDIVRNRDPEWDKTVRFST
jgi:cellulose synthase/poly-beta-1,6-N-acetylglucosamine synthase-like glycosyltransferase